MKEHGATVIHKCVAVKHALSAQECGVDAITMVGYEAGGHPGMEDVGLSVLVQKAAQTLKVPVLAGGGCVDGRGLAAALCWGAEGVVMGTRFYITKENPVLEEVKKMALQVSERDTVMIQRSIKNALRVVKNSQAKKVLEAEARGATLEEMMPLISGLLSREHMAKGELDDAIISVGESIGLIDDIPTTKEVVERTVSQAEEIIRRLNTIL
jgi:nitronate monooxygenase